MSMARTTVYLPPEMKRRLTTVARHRHVSEAELIRDGIESVLASETQRPRPNLPLFHNVDHTIADRVDDLLAEGFGASGLDQ